MIKSASRSSITNDQKYRSMLAGTVPSNEYLIDSRILTTTTPSVTFSNLQEFAGIYKHLQIVIVGRTDRAANTGDAILIRLNGDQGTNYSIHGLFGNGSTVTSYGFANTNELEHYRLTASASAGNAFGASIIDILDSFSTTKNKTIRSMGGATDVNDIRLASGLYRSTTPISTIEIRALGSYVAGSRFSLYGVTA